MPQGTEGGELQLNGGHADLQALEVGHLGDGMLGVGDMAVTGAQPAEGTGAALLGDKVVHLLHESIIGEDLGVLVETGETIGKIEDAGRGGERSQVAAGEDSHMDFRRTQLLHIGLFVAHGATDEFLNLNLAARFLLDDFLEFIDSDNMLAAIRVGRGRTDGHSLVLDGAGGNRTAENQSQSTHQSNNTFHTFLLGKKFGIKTNKQNEGHLVKKFVYFLLKNLFPGEKLMQGHIHPDLRLFPSMRTDKSQNFFKFNENNYYF